MSAYVSASYDPRFFSTSNNLGNLLQYSGNWLLPPPPRPFTFEVDRNGLNLVWKT